jgi:pyruvate,water dikinase
MLASIQLFDDFLADVAGPEVDGHTMLTGVQTESLANGIAITDLAAAARALGVASVVLETPSSELVSTLQTTAEGQELLNQINVYLAEYGLTQSMFDFVLPTWLEEPTPLYSTLRSYLETGSDNRAAHAEQIRRAAEATDAMRERLATYPEPIRHQFEVMLAMARTGSFLQEEHNFYIDQQLLSSVRLAFLALGRQLVHHGLLDQADQIFFLHVDEIRALLAGKQLDARAIVAERLASYEAAMLETPPLFIGAPPAGPPPDNPVTRAMSRFFGWAPPAADDSGPLRGYAGSRGQVTAPAFVARSQDEAAAIPVGHVLVTITTSPSWTPLFGIAAAIVTETGGPLSHCAIVAREYGLPAVVGVRGATSRIETGQLIQVDGTVGEVTLLS